MSEEHGKNDHRYADYIKRVRGYGAASAKGKDALPQHMLDTLKQAAEGVLDLVPDKHDKGVDDAHASYVEYTKAAGKTLYAHKANSFKAQVSKLRTVVKAGVHPHGDPYGDVDRAVVMHQEMHGNDPKSVQTLSQAIGNVCRDIVGTDQSLTDDEIREAIAKSESETKTVAKELVAIHKKMERLITGSAGVRHQSDALVKAEELLREELSVQGVDVSPKTKGKGKGKKGTDAATVTVDDYDADSEYAEADELNEMFETAPPEAEAPAPIDDAR
jgi:hypothetical protein